MSIAANKVKGAYAALCMNEEMAKMSRLHNNANILALGASLLSKERITKIVDVWISQDFEGGRHRRRFNKIKKEE
ncbi:Ribose-5-phosphate isomerase B [subsurface metagenome]